MPGRKFNSGNYRFGFNGKENDKEWGNQLIQDYGFRLYNPAIGKFLSVDPLSPDYPWYTPYQFAGNMPINSIDLDGLEEKRVIHYYDMNGKIYDTQVRIQQDKQLEEKGYTYAVTYVTKIYDDPNRVSTTDRFTEKIDAESGRRYDGAYPSARYNYSKYGAKDDWKKMYEDISLMNADVDHRTLRLRDLRAPDNAENSERLDDGGTAITAGVPPLLAFLGKGSALRPYRDIDFSDEAASLINGNYVTASSATRKIPEVITVTKSGSLKDAIAIARTKVGSVKAPLVSKLGPEKGKVVGIGTQQNHYRLDWSEELGVHLNWQTKGEKGAIPLNMSKKTYEQNIDRLNKNLGN